MKTLFTNWFIFWEGVLIDHFWGLHTALLYMLVWWIFGLGIKLGLKAARK